MHTAYDDALAFLHGRVNYEGTSQLPYRLRSFKLDRMRRLLELLGNPQDALPAVHIAGTKGKGSTATMIASALIHAGYRTGLYTSPHLAGVEERMTIDGRTCPLDRLTDLVQRIRPLVEQLDREAAADGRAGDGPTYFEITTALAMKYFAEQAVDLAVLEVGLGGRLDSTNVCRPAISVITSIGFDHMAQLGSTLTAIAAEKAGIIKRRVPVVTGVTDAEPLAVIERIAANLDCPLWKAGVHFQFAYQPPRTYAGETMAARVHYRAHPDDPDGDLIDLELCLRGRHQAGNAATAVATLRRLRSLGWRIQDEAIRQGLATANCPARVELIARQPTVVLDAAHNVESVEALVETLAESFAEPCRTLVFASSRDKDIDGMLRRLLPAFQHVILTRFANPRGADPVRLGETAVRIAEEIAQVAPQAPTIRVIENPCSAWRTAFQNTHPHHLICVTGSFFLASELRSTMLADCASARPAVCAAAV